MQLFTNLSTQYNSVACFSISDCNDAIQYVLAESRNVIYFMDGKMTLNEAKLTSVTPVMQHYIMTPAVYVAHRYILTVHNR